MDRDGWKWQNSLDNWVGVEVVVSSRFSLREKKCWVSLLEREITHVVVLFIEGESKLMKDQKNRVVEDFLVSSGGKIFSMSLTSGDG